MKNLPTRIAKLEAADPAPIRFILAGKLARGEKPNPPAFTFWLSDPRAERNAGDDRDA